MSIADDPLQAADLTSKLGPARRRLPNLTVPRSARTSAAPPAAPPQTSAPVLAASSPPPDTSAPAPAKRAKRAVRETKAAPLRAAGGPWASQTVNAVPAAVAAAFTAEAAERGVSKGDVLMLAVRTELEAALAELETARVEVRAPRMPELPGDQTPTRLMVRIREADREHIRETVEAKLGYYGALSDAYRWCLQAFLAGKHQRT